jgi:hypothetical protein
MDPIGWILGLGLVALLYLALPIAAIVIVALLIVRRRSRRFGGSVVVATLALAAVLAPWVNWGFDSEVATTKSIVLVLVLYVGQIAIVCLLGGVVFRLCIWLWRRASRSFRPRTTASD